MAVNQLNGVGDDGEDGKWVASLAKREANYFQLVTARGKLLGGFFLNGVNGEGYPEFESAMTKWRKLPAAERAPGPLNVKPAPASAAAPKPPEGGLILRVYTRNLKRDRKGELARITPTDVKDRKSYPDVSWAWANAIYTEPMPDVMWLTEAEWKSLIPANPTKGDTYEVPDPIKLRMFRYHLIDGTFGLAHGWKLEHIRSGSLTLTVTDTSPSLRMRLDGKVLLATDAKLEKGHHGFDAKLRGSLVYELTKKQLTSFDIVAVGDCWGGDWEGGRFARPSRAPLGVAFELATGKSVAERISPKGVKFKELAKSYFTAEKP